MFVLLSAFRWQSAPKRVEEGNRLFEKGEYEKALSRYYEAESKRPDAPEIPFNIGNSFYKQKRYPEAMDAHRRSAELGSDALKAKAYYNIGNSLYREGNLEASLEAFKKAVDLDSGDIDTKYNIEVILRKRQDENRPKPQSSASQSKPQEEPEQKDQKEDSSKDEKDQKEEEKQKPEPKDDKEGSSESKQNDISRQDAERLLGGLQAEERPLSASQEGKQKPHREPPVEKDW